MTPEAKQLYKTIEQAHAECHVLLNKIEARIKSLKSATDGADIAYALRETYGLADDTRKRLNSLGEFAQKMTCVIGMAAGDVGSIKTDHVTATPDCKIIATPPKRSTDPEAYHALMSWLGVKKELLDDPNHDECVRVHFPGMVDLISRRAAEGLPLPPGIDPNKTYPQYRLIMRKRKGVLE